MTDQARVEGGYATEKTQASVKTAVETLASSVSTPVTPRNENATDTPTGSVTGATSETVPADAVGFFLQADSGNSANIRWRAGGTASATAGHELEPGRDTGYVPLAKTLSLCAASGTQAYALTWIRR